MEVAALGLSVDSSGVVRGIGDLDKFTKAANDAGTAADRTGRDAKKGGDNIRKMGDDASKAGGQFGGLARQAKALGGALTAALSIRAIAQTADAWSDMQSRVGAAVKDMQAAPELMQRMVDIANASYSPLAQTVEVYGRNVAVLGELGKSAVEAANFTEALNNALVITATRGERAASVQNALSKAMAVGKLDAQGLETVLNNGGAVAEALAAELNTTVNGLRAMTTEGRVTGEVIANSLIKRFDELKARAEEMPATMSDGVVRIQNNFTQLIGTLDQTYGVSQAIANGLLTLADNLGTVASVVATGTAAWLSYRLAVLAVSAAQTFAMTTWGASLVAAHAQLGLLGAAQVALISGTAGLTAGIKALTIAMLANPVVWLTAGFAGLFAVIQSVISANAAAEARFKANALAAQSLGLALNDAQKAAIGATSETNSLGGAASASEPKIWSFKNATDGLTQSLWEQAKAARAARVEMLQQQLTAAQDRQAEAFGLTGSGVEAGKAAADRAFREGDLLRGFSEVYNVLSTRWKQVLSGGRVQREAIRDYQDATRVAAEAQKQLKAALESPIGASDVPERMAAVAAAETKVATAAKAVKAAVSDQSQALDDRNEATIRYIASLESEVERIGLNEQALRALEVAKARDVAVTDEQRKKIDELAAAREAALAADAVRKDDEAFNASIEALKRQRGELMLAGAALEEYRYISERLLDAQSRGIVLTDEQTQKIRDQAAAYVGLKSSIEAQAEAWDKISRDAEAQRDATLERMSEQLNEARNFVGSLWAEMIDGARNGAKASDIFINTVLNGLNRIGEKMADRTLSGLLDSIFSGSTSGGFLGGLLGGSPTPFAKGGAFTNTVVDTPTLFRFAKGGAIGEMGEAGPEAIMPLKRGPDGSLGVQMHGGGQREIVLVVKAEEGKLFRPTVEEVANNSAVQVVTASLTEFNDQLPARVEEISNDPRMR